MKALRSHSTGGAESLVLDELLDPIAQPGQLLLRVLSCGVNYPDLLLIQDLYQVKPPRPFAPGGEVAAIVEAIGLHVHGFRVGDFVIGRCGWGGMAEKVALDADRCTHAPAAMHPNDAAVFLFTYATAYHALRDRAQLRQGETLLVLGAAGGVGSAAVEVGRALGAHVIAAASSAEKAAYAVNRGAHESMVYPGVVDGTDASKLLASQFKSAAGSGGVDVVFDPVGGGYSEAALRATGRNGRFLVVGFTAGIPRLPLNLPLLKACSVVGVDWRAFNQYEPQKSATNNSELFSMWESGQLRPDVSEVFSLSEGGKAIHRLSQRDVLGKIVVQVQ